MELCEETGKFLKNISKHQHLKAVHTSEKLFECEDNQCRNFFKTVKDLTRHVKRDVHHIDSFSCDLCTKRFKTKGNVAKHVQSVHEGKLYFFCFLWNWTQEKGQIKTTLCPVQREATKEFRK